MSYTNGLDKPTDYFNTKLYTGNASTNAITGVGFQPDWVWLKNRSSAYHHRLFDSVRGTTKNLSSNRTDAESTESGLTSFDSDGFTLGSDGGANNNTDNYVAWNWKAGGSASSNTDGSITSTVSANTTAGFSIVSCTGTGSNATVGHGLGVAPKVIITKSRVNAENWGFYHQSLGNGKQLELNTTASQKTSSAYYNNTSPTSTVFSVGTADSTNDNQNMIAYCFADTGNKFFKAGSYTGNGNADGTFIYTGFKPAFVLFKQTNTSGGHWYIYDNKRGQNELDEHLYPNLSSAEATGDNAIDILSNGFKMRSSNGDSNASGGTYIYMAFAESPFVTGASAIPTTAR